MINPLSDGEILVLDEVESTQKVARSFLEGAQPGPVPGAILARSQTAGRGRFERSWVSGPGDSLTVSWIFSRYPNHPRPWLVGMALALAVAEAVHARVSWPNDIVLRGKKVGGILTELMRSENGLIPVVGLGVNLNQESFDEALNDRATSLFLESGQNFSPLELAIRIGENMESLPDPSSWERIRGVWALFDQTPGKLYRLADGRAAVAVEVGHDGQLLCSIEGESMVVQAADAIFGPNLPS